MQHALVRDYIIEWMKREAVKGVSRELEAIRRKDRVARACLKECGFGAS